MRKKFLDNIRWMTVVLVVIYHILYMYNAEGVVGVIGKVTDLDVQYYDVYQYIVYPWFMCILFMVSGISSRLYLDKHSGKEFAKSRTRKLLVPSTIGLLAFQFIQGYFNMSMGEGIQMLKGMPAPVAFLIMSVSGIGVLWYIQTLWILSMLLLLFRRIEKDRLWKMGEKTNVLAMILFVVPVWAFGQILNTPIICVYRFGLYGLLFFLGYFVFSHDEVIERLKKYFVLFLIPAIILGLLFCIANFGNVYADAPVNRTPVFLAYAWFACLAILGGMAKFGDFENRFTRFMNRYNFGLYVFHYLGISMVAVLLVKPGTISAIPAYLLSTVAAFTVPFVLYGIISKIPVYRWMVLGIKKDKRGN